MAAETGLLPAYIELELNYVTNAHILIKRFSMNMQLRNSCNIIDCFFLEGSDS